LEESNLPEEARSFLASWLGEGWTAQPLRGDASIRAYYRVSAPGGERYMVCYYPESLRPDLHRFLRAYGSIERHASVPAVLKYDEAAVAQDDVGDVTLFDVLHQDRDRGLRLYQRAVDLLVGFQRAPRLAGEVNPPFDHAKFLGELEMTSEFYVRKLHSVSVSDSLTDIFDQICTEITSHPYVLCHRDYHGQNLHVVNEELFVIDYQDLRMGPDTYDLASLLRDRGVGEIIGEHDEDRLIEYYAGRIDGAEGLRRRYFVSLLQRSLKILGTFARQALERGRTHYLDFVPSALGSVERALAELPEYAELRSCFPMSYSKHN
jgi:aminoglycoside/choline kinase family phosphotransferase